MQIIKNVYNIVLDALFPRSSAEVEALAYSPEEAFVRLPRASKPPLGDSYSIFAYKDERVAKLVWNVKYKESLSAIAIGGYALYKWLVELTGVANIVFVDTPSISSADKETMADEIASGSRHHFDGGKRSKTSSGGSETSTKTMFATPVSSNTRNEQIKPAYMNSTRQNLIVVPIPITKKRRNERGYNQCELLVDEMGRLDTENHFTVRKDLLERVQHLSRQTLKNREDRLESAKGIFAVNDLVVAEIFDQNISQDGSKIENTTIFVIDDVITTGSTMKEAMATLGNAGFKRVFGLSLAH